MGESFKLRGVLANGLLLALALASASGANAQVTVDPTPIPYGGIGQPYSYQLQASPGNSFVWSPTGSVAPGLNLAPNGALSSNSALQAGTYSFQVTATAVPGGASGAATLTLTVVDVSTPAQLPPGQVTVPYSQQLGATAGSAGGWSVVTGALPAGVTLSSGGALQGTPQQFGNFSFTAAVIAIFRTRTHVATTAFDLPSTVTGLAL